MSRPPNRSCTSQGASINFISSFYYIAGAEAKSFEWSTNIWKNKIKVPHAVLIINFPLLIKKGTAELNCEKKL